MELTREQKLALCRDRHISVIANAGSGKTKILIDKYIDILLNDEKVNKDPRRILAITFTKNAAAEMKSRLIKKIEEMIQSATEREHLWHLNNIREKLGYANISTIHSFCSRLLRDYPIEAGISPNFTELADIDLYNLREAAIFEVIEDRLSSKDDYVRTSTENLIKLHGVANVKSVLDTLFNKSEVLSIYSEFYKNRSDEEICAFYDSVFITYIQTLIPVFTPTMSCYVGIELTDKQNNELADLRGRALDSLDSMNRAKTLAELTIEFKVLEGIIKSKFGKGNTSLNSYTEKSPDMGETYKATYKALKDLITECSKSELHPQTVACSRALVEIAEDAKVLLDEMKNEVSGIDFDDMIIKASALLQQEETASLVRSKFDHALIDEFQDTNQTQYDIATALSPGLLDNSKDIGPRTFIVGDAKQSIYAFRNADVSVFMKARKDIGEVNQSKIDSGDLNKNLSYAKTISFNPEMIEIISNDNEAKGDLKLTSSFRLNPVVAAFVNKTCGEIMSDATEEYEAKYEDLVFAKDIDKFKAGLDKNPQDDGSYYLNDEYGSVRFLLTFKEKAATKVIEPDDLSVDSDEPDEESADEALKLAYFINSAVSGKIPMPITEKDGFRAPRYGDFCILSRSRTGFNKLLKAFIDHKIPYVLHSGGGFYKSQEVAEVASYLKFLHNPKDDLSFASLCKSAFIGFSDDDLYNFSCLAGDGLYEKFLTHVNSFECEEFDKYKRADQIISKIRKFAARSGVSAIVSEILCTGGLQAAIAKSPRKKQIEANLYKLQNLADNFEKKGFKNLFDFVTEIGKLEDMSKEPEAAFVSGENAVNIMTTHASKGKEFNIVVLYYSHNKPNNREQFVLSPQMGLVIKAIGANKENSYDASISTPIFKIAKKLQAAKEEAEDKRVLYVALTRAREHLIISGCVNANKTGYTAKGVMQGLLNVVTPSFKDEDYAFTDITISQTLPFLEDGIENHMEIEYPVRFHLDIAPAENMEIVHDEDIRLNDIYLESFDGNFVDEEFSATRLEMFSNKNEYYRKYLLGITEKEALEKEKELTSMIDSDNIPEAKGLGFGVIIHSVFESISYWLDATGAMLQDKLLEVVDAICSKVSANEREPFKHRALQECEKVAQTKLIQRYAPALNKSAREYSVIMPVGEDFLKGSLDCVIEDENGNLEIWDWKSNVADNKEMMISKSRHYELQMKIYAYFIAQIKPNQEKISCRLLFTNRADKDRNDDEWTVAFEFNKSKIEEIKTEIEVLIKNARIERVFSKIIN